MFRAQKHMKLKQNQIEAMVCRSCSKIENGWLYCCTGESPIYSGFNYDSDNWHGRTCWVRWTLFLPSNNSNDSNKSKFHCWKSSALMLMAIGKLASVGCWLQFKLLRFWWYLEKKQETQKKLPLKTLNCFRNC